MKYKNDKSKEQHSTDDCILFEFVLQYPNKVTKYGRVWEINRNKALERLKNRYKEYKGLKCIFLKKVYEVHGK